MALKPVMYFHCKRCIDEDARQKISAGVAADGNLIVWCDNHDIPVGKFTLKTPFDVSKLQCAHCGEPLGPNHKH